MKYSFRNFVMGCSVAALPTFGAAFEEVDYVDETIPMGNCVVERMVSDTVAYVRIVVDGGRGGTYYAGGTFFGKDSVQTRSPLTIDSLGSCWGYANPTGLFANGIEQNGLDNGGYATDNYIGFRFTTTDLFSSSADPYLQNETYEFKVGRGSFEINLAVNPGPTIEETQGQIAPFMQSRANQMIAAQPDLIGLLSGAASGAFNVQATQGNGSFDFATSGDRNVWARLQGSWSEYDNTEASYVFGVAGAHTTVGAGALLGLMVQFDQAEQTRGDAVTDGTGYLVGPYLVSKLPDQPMYFEGRLLLGKTYNAVNADGNTPENFETTRALASAKVAGNLEFGALILTPNLTATHLSETQEAFTDSADNDIPEQSITMTDIALGLDVAQVFTLEGGALTLSGGVAAVMSSADGSGFAENVVPTFDGERGRVHLGARYALESGMILSAGTSFDGLGSDDFASTSVNVGLQMQF